MNMMQSIIRNSAKYLELLFDLLSEHDVISDPKQLFELIEVSEHKGKTVGWQIDNKEIKFQTDDFMDCDEGAILNGDRYIIDHFSYHFNPSTNSALNSYRIDFDRGDLHLNPDHSLEYYYGHHITPEQLDLDIDNFNCVLAIQLALLYITQRIYPAERQAAVYNKALNGIRRKLA